MVSDFYTKLSAQEKMFLYITLGVILAAVFDFLFLQPVFSKLKTLDVAIVQTKDDIRRDVRYLAYKEKIFKEKEIYRAYKLDEAKTEDQIFSAFLGAVENFAREVEVNPGKLNPGDVVRKKGYAEYFANMECSGKFENIIKLIHKIDTTPNLLKVVKINIIAKKSSADEVTVSMKISKLIIDAKTVADNLDLEVSTKESSAALTGLSGAPLGGSMGTPANNNSKGGKSDSSGENSGGGNVGGSENGGDSGNGGGSGSGGGNTGDTETGNGINGGAGNAGGGNGDGGSGGGNGDGGSGGGNGDGGSGGGNGGGARGSGGNSGAGVGADATTGDGQNGVENASDAGAGGTAPASGTGSGGIGDDSNADQKEGSQKSGGVVIGASAGNAGRGDTAKIGAKSRRAGSRSGGSDVGGDSGDSDGEAGAVGNSGSTSSSKGSQNKSDKKQKSLKEENSKDKTKTPTPLDKVASGERAQVKNLESLWNDFWGIKPKVKEAKPLTQREKEELRRDQEQEDDVKPNLFERMLEPKQ